MNDKEKNLVTGCLCDLMNFLSLLSSPVPPPTPAGAFVTFWVQAETGMIPHKLGIIPMALEGFPWRAVLGLGQALVADNPGLHDKWSLHL